MLVTLVNKDQLDILATLRESVNEDKAGLETEVQELQGHIKELSDKNKMQLEQINALLFEKVNLQSEGIDQREKMLQRERAIGYVRSRFQMSGNLKTIFRDLRASISGKDVPEDIKARLLSLHEENIVIKEQYKTAQDKLTKAKAVRHEIRLDQLIVLNVSYSSSSNKTSSSRRSMRRRVAPRLR